MLQGIMVMGMHCFWIMNVMIMFMRLRGIPVLKLVSVLIQ